MGNGRTGEFSEAAKAPAVLSVVLEAWWRVASTPGDLVDILVATAGAGLLAGTFSGCLTSERDAAHQPCSTGGLDPRPSDAPN
jgi:hypothetical protein